ncbi:unknown [Clostridium sp. CAG:798]|nr:unknown [Clostridium sp. CAG:798]
MCLKPENRTKEELAEQILKDTKELIEIAKESKLKENLYEYELIKLNSKTPLLDEQSRSLIGITSEEYIDITENYDELIAKYPDVKERALRHLEYIKSANIAKIIALKGCENCRLIVCEKLDVKENDLCDNCKKLIAEYKL